MAFPRCNTCRHEPKLTNTAASWEIPLQSSLHHFNLAIEFECLDSCIRTRSAQVIEEFLPSVVVAERFYYCCARVSFFVSISTDGIHRSGIVLLDEGVPR